MNVLAYSFSHWLFFPAFSCFGTEVLLFLSVFCSGVCSAVLCNRREGQGPGVHGWETGLGPATYWPQKPGKGTASGLRCPLPPPHRLCGKGDVVGEVPGTRWHVGGSLSAVAVAFLKAECTRVWFM